MNQSSSKMGRAARRLLLWVGAFLLLAGRPQALEAATWVNGDVFAGIGGGTYQVYSNTGVFKESIFDGLGGITTGGAFDSAGNLYTTSFSTGRVIKFDGVHPHAIMQTIVTGDTSPESLVFASNGEFYVGHADGAGTIRKFNAAGVFQQAFSVAREARGSDWIELASDQRTMFYTSEGRRVMRFDVMSNMQLPDFALLPGGGNAFALRLLPPGDGSAGLIVADRSNIKRLNSAGAVVQTYDAPGEDTWFAMNLDPNGTSFWGSDAVTGRFYRFNISTGAIEVGPIATGSFNLNGLIVKGEITGGQPPTTATITAFTFTPSTVKGGTNSTGKVTISAPAGSGGAVISLMSANTGVVQVPPSVTIPAGQTMATFTATTTSADATTPVVVTATSANSLTATLTRKDSVGPVGTFNTNVTDPSTGNPAVDVTVTDGGSNLMFIDISGINMMFNGVRISSNPNMPTRVFSGSPATKVRTFRVVVIDPFSQASLKVVAKDACGNLGDPLYGRGSTDPGGLSVVTGEIYANETVLEVTNRGVQHVQCQVGTSRFQLQADSKKSGWKGSTCYIKENGKTVIDIARFVRQIAGTRPVQFTLHGKPGGSIIFYIHPR